MEVLVIGHAREEPTRCHVCCRLQGAMAVKSKASLRRKVEPWSVCGSGAR